MITQSSASLAYVPAVITASKQGAPYNPTSDAVTFAFTAVGTSAQGATWSTGSWDGTNPLPGTVSGYVAQCLVGPGGTVQLAAGTYQVWVKITDSPEIPVLPAFLLQIT